MKHAPRPPGTGLWRLVMLLLCLISGMARGGGTEIIVSPDQAAVAIDRGMLRAIFTTRLRQWPDGTPIHVFVMPDDSELHDLFCREQLGMYPYVLRELWDRLLYTGTGLTPTLVHSQEDMRNRVLATRGGIGYLPAGSDHAPGTAFRGGSVASMEHAKEKDNP